MVTASDGADLIITGGAVRTLNPTVPTAEALAVAGGRIVALGTAADIARLRGPLTRVIELHGETVLPGFQDAHVHPLHGGQGLLECNLLELPLERGAYLDAIAAYAAAHPDDKWITGRGWSMPVFPGGTPSRHDLDSVVPHRPAVFDNRDAHGVWVNTAALARAGITRDTPDPPDGRIEREPDGSPQGTLHEGAVRLVKDLVPAYTQARWEEALLAAQAHLLALGITSVTDAWVEPHQVEPYAALAEDGRLLLRTNLALWWARGGDLGQLDWLQAARRRAAVGRPRANTIKLMLDGVLENGSATLLEPYIGADGAPTTNRGIPFIDPERLAREFAPALDGAGFQLHFHAIGDAAVRTGLDAVEAVIAANGRRDRRASIAHLQVIHPADIGRFAVLDVGANIQPYWASHDAQMDALTIPFMGPERTARQYPFASLVHAGARLVGGSDWSVSTANVMEEIEVATRRADPHDRAAEPFLPAQALTLDQAVRAFTQGAAWANGLDAETGTLAPGFLADLVILDRDIFDTGAGFVADTKVRATVLNGDVVFEVGA